MNDRSSTIGSRAAMFAVAMFLALALWHAAPARAADFDVANENVAELNNAINAANQNNEADTIRLAPNGTYTLTAADNEANGPNGLPSVASEITIQGNGATIRRSGEANTPTFRIFHVSATGNLTVEKATVSGGDGDIFSGGGVRNASGTLAVIDSTVSGNTTTSGNGGGLLNDSGTMTVERSTVSGNTTNGFFGGGVANFNGTMTVEKSTVSGNEARDGGGVVNFFGAMTIEGSTVSGNSASDRGGGIFSNTTSLNLDNPASRTVITNSTVSSNTRAGGVFNLNGRTEVSHATITDNEAPAGQAQGVASSGNDSTLTLVGGSIVAANKLGGPDVALSGGTVDSFRSAGHNLIGTTGSAAFTDGANGDRIIGNSPPGLEPLADNGGPTRTHALASDGPAVDAVSPAACPPPATDQRGVERPKGLSCDIGAFEREGASDLSIRKTARPDPATVGEDLTYTLRVANLGPDIAPAVKVEDALPAGVNFGSASTGCDGDNRVVRCDAGDMADAETKSFTITVIPTEANPSLENTAEVASAARPDPYPFNDSDSATVEVREAPRADLSLEKEASSAAARVGEEITYTLRVRNDGPDAATGIEIEDSLPDEVSFVSASPGCNEANLVVTCAVGTRGSGDTSTRTVTVRVDDAGDIVNEAVVSSATDDPDMSNNEASASVEATDPDGTAVTLGSSSGVVLFGRAAILSGTLADADGNPLAGRDVLLERRLVGGQNFVRVATLTTNSSGAFRGVVNPARHTVYRASFAGDTREGASESVSRVNVRTLLTSRISRRDVEVGRPVAVAGIVRPARGGTVRVAIVRGGQTVLVRNVRLDGDSRYRFVYRPPRPGNHAVVVQAAPTGGNLGNVSAQRFRATR